jgi:transcriptional regulator with GAF, ATPase, and Fis domain
VTDSLSNEELRRLFDELGFVAGSDTLAPLLRQASKAACVSDLTILIEGETGTGKQVLAQAIHRLDEKRRGRPFITVHCSTISEGLAESELFGHERGAFSGAVQPRKGLFKIAHGGTLFLDDVNDLPAALQPKLLDVLQRGTVRAVGSDQESRIDVRIIAASNQPLSGLVQQRRFRTDLYHRLNVVRLKLPPLRERPEDIPALVLAFARRHQDIYPGITAVDPELVRFIAAQRYEGNIRELEHAVERAMFTKAQGVSLGLADWISESQPVESGSGNDLVGEAADRLLEAILQHGVPYDQAIRQTEKTLLESAMRSGRQTRRELASRLQTSERTLYHRMRSHGLSKARGG